MNIEAKPELTACPFCGSTDAPHVADEGDFSYAVLCDYNLNGCGAAGGRRSRAEEAVGAWNQRLLAITWSDIVK